MRLVDMIFFQAEHDDYHLARIHELSRLFGDRFGPLISKRNLGMLNRILMVMVVFIGLQTTTMAQQSLDQMTNGMVNGMIDREIQSLLETYKTLHAAPELSHYEQKTSALFANHLRTMGYAVTERVGKFERPEWVGYGVVAVMKNGDGPTVLVRTVSRRPYR